MSDTNGKFDWRQSVITVIVVLVTAAVQWGVMSSAITDHARRLDLSLTLETLAEKMRPHHNEIGIMHDCDLVRLIGVRDGGDDFYYIGIPFMVQQRTIRA